MQKDMAQQEVQRFKELFLQVANQEANAVAELLTASSDSDLLGKTELALRDAVHRMGAKMQGRLLDR